MRSRRVPSAVCRDGQSARPMVQGQKWSPPRPGRRKTHCGRWWAVFFSGHKKARRVCGRLRALTKPTTAKIALIYKKSEAIFASCRWICRALRDRQIQSPLATNFAAGKISSSAALASCGHLRPCKLPWMQVCFLGLRAFSTLCQSVDFVNILKRPRQAEALSFCPSPDRW